MQLGDATRVHRASASQTQHRPNRGSPVLDRRVAERADEESALWNANISPTDSIVH
jgi:hypothetical protein